MTTRIDTEGSGPDAVASPTAATTVLGPAQLASHTKAPTTVPSRSLGMGTRFSIATAVLLLVTLGALLLVVDGHAHRVARESIRGDLSRAPAIFGAYQADLQARAGNQVRSVAGEPGTKAVFDPGVSLSTRHEFALDSAHVLAGARTVFLFGGDAKVLARSDRQEGEGVGQDFQGARWVREPLETWRETTAVIREGKDLSVVAASPVISGSGDMARIDGVLAASFPLTEAHAAALQGLTRGEVAFLVDRRQAGRVAAAGALDGHRRLRRARRWSGRSRRSPAPRRPCCAAASRTGRSSSLVEKARRICLAVPILGSSGEPYGAFLVSRSLAAEMAAFDRIRRTLFLVGGVGLLLAVPASFLLGRRLSRPLRQLAAGATAIRDGDLDVALPESGGGEVGELASRLPRHGPASCGRSVPSSS